MSRPVEFLIRLRRYVDLPRAKPGHEAEFFAECTRRTTMPGFERRQRSNRSSVNPELRRNLVDFLLHTLCEREVEQARFNISARTKAIGKICSEPTVRWTVSKCSRNSLSELYQALH
jgi:hypothetical protein